MTEQGRPPVDAPPPVPSVAAQIATMGLVVGTLTYLPGAVVVGLACRLLGIAPDALVTFGGMLGFFAGLFAWWALAIVAGVLYAACVFPWELLPTKTNGRK